MNLFFWRKPKYVENVPSLKSSDELPPFAVKASDAEMYRMQYINEEALRLTNLFDEEFDNRVKTQMRLDSNKCLCMQTRDKEVFDIAKWYIIRQLDLRGFRAIITGNGKLFNLFASWQRVKTITNEN